MTKLRYIFLVFTMCSLVKSMHAEQAVETKGALEIEEKERPKVKIGGALRFNYNLSNWKKEQAKRGGDFGYELFRITAEASYKKLNLSAEYRLYDRELGGGMLRSGIIGYKFNSSHDLQLGLVQVPFGITDHN